MLLVMLSLGVQFLFGDVEGVCVQRDFVSGSVCCVLAFRAKGV